MNIPASVEGFNETDVREEIISPLLRHLGYQRGTSANVHRELWVRYPYTQLGRKNPKIDPPLRGRADYVLEVDGLVRWTIEAKPPSSPISVDDLDQAHSYAIHPRIGAVYFAVTNGSELRVYQTVHGPDADAILVLTLNEIVEKCQVLENLLSPSSIRRDHPSIKPDTGRPIGPGLRSLVQIVGGAIEMHDCAPPLPLLAEMMLHIDEGAIDRDDDGRLVIYVTARSPFRPINEFNKRHGLDELQLTSSDSVLSVDQALPTTFHQTKAVIFPAGDRFRNLFGEGDYVFQNNVECTYKTVATGAVAGKRFVGIFTVEFEYHDLVGIGTIYQVTMSGEFETVFG